VSREQITEITIGVLAMEEKKLVVKCGGKSSVTFSIPLPSDLDEAINAYGTEQVLYMVRAQVQQMARVTARNLLSYEHAPERVRERMEMEWKATKRLRKEAVDLSKLRPEDKEGIL